MLKISVLLLFCLLPLSNELPVEKQDAIKSYIMGYFDPYVKEALFFARNDSKMFFFLFNELPVKKTFGYVQSYLRHLLEPFIEETLIFARNCSDLLYLNLVIRQSPFADDERILSFYDGRHVSLNFKTQNAQWLTLCMRMGTEGLRMDRFQARNHTFFVDLYCHVKIEPMVKPEDYSWIWDYLTYFILISILVFLVSSIYRRTFCNSKKMPEDTPMTTSP